MKNLFLETVQAVDVSGHIITDIIYIGSLKSGHSCTWSEFYLLANIEYNNGHGGVVIATDLVIVFTDGSKLWRNSEDGAEWWQFMLSVNNPIRKKPITDLVIDCSDQPTLKEINQ